MMTLDKAYLIAIWLESLFYGINSVLVWACVFVLVHKKSRRDINFFLLLIVITQYLVSTADVSLALTRLITAFIDSSGQPGGAIGYFSDEPQPVNVAQLLFISTNSVLNDVVIVWRCYHIWGKNWKIIAFPALLVFGTLACGIGQGVSFRTLKNAHDVFSHHIVPWNLSFYFLSLATNIIGTSLISFRIWSMLQMSSMGAAYTRLLTLIIESGMMYSAVLIIGLGLYFSNTVTFFIVYEQLGQLASIMPTMILLLVGLKMTSSDVQVRMSTTKNNTSSMPTSSTGYQRTTTTSHHMKPVAIDVTNSREYNSEYDLKVLSSHRQDEYGMRV